jgi:hypothetical protein
MNRRACAGWGFGAGISEKDMLPAYKSAPNSVPSDKKRADSGSSFRLKRGDYRCQYSTAAVI